MKTNTFTLFLAGVATALTVGMCSFSDEEPPPSLEGACDSCEFVCITRDGHVDCEFICEVCDIYAEGEE